MAMIHKNLTPFFWGPKVTSRKPPQVEMAVCVRAVFKLVPGQPLVAIEDPMEQGFLSGDTFLPEDIDQRGALVTASDFAEWKLHGEMLLKGTCHPPGGSATSCNVRFAVGNWSKTLRVVGPRVFRPGMLMGGTMSEPLPFEQMPLSWQNAYGGTEYPLNPVGRGFNGPEMPTVEIVDAPITKQGKRNVVPATFLPQSPHWPQRAGKRGKKYDATWKRTRAPFYAEDFDWTYFQSAPEDQRLDGYLRGDEDVVFENLHPAASNWQTKLPGLRIRSFVKTQDGSVREPEMHLDTLYADLDAGKLYLTWRGHAPIREIDMTDVAVVLIASEPLHAEPKPFADYEAQLLEFEKDPVGLEAAMPPGFLAVANAIQAAELAERNGEPMPDLSTLAANLPAGCPFPPWFLTAAAGHPDPLGMEAKFPPGMLGDDDPLGVRDKIGELGDKDKLEKALEGLPDAKTDPAAAIAPLRRLALLMPPDKQPAMNATADAIEQAIATARAADGGAAMQKAIAAQPPTAAPVPASEALANTIAGAKSQLASAAEAAAAGNSPGKEAVLAKLADASAKLDKAPTSLDDIVGKALAPLDAMPMPELPVIPDVEGQIAAEREKLIAQEQKMRDKQGDEPMLAMFQFGHRLLDNAPRPANLVPDFAPLVAIIQQTHAALAAQGIGAVALAPLLRLKGRVEAVVAQLPQRPPAPTGKYALQNLVRRDFRNQDLRGEVFARSDLTGATFSGANLAGASFRDANATSADFTGANLTEVDFSHCTLSKARLTDVGAERCKLADAELSGADLSNSNLAGADLQQARLGKANLSHANLTGANLSFADLSKADLRHANLHRAQLTLAVLDLVKGDHANFSEATADMVKLTTSRLPGANLRGMQSSMGSFVNSDLTGADLRECRFTKVDFMKAVLNQATFDRASLKQSILRDTQAIGASFRDADLGGASATGAANFQKADFRGAKAQRSVWMDVEFTGANLSSANFEHANFQGSHGEDVDFAGSQLKATCFQRAQLKRPRFAQADLCSVDFNNTQLDDANFRNANCYDVKFLGARAVRSDFEGAFTEGIQVDDDKAGKP
jgi:uncharacterized protein YjbI with pentapeptide repeats